SESNQGHRDFQSLALPTELSGQRGALNRIGHVSSTGFCNNRRVRHPTDVFYDDLPVFPSSLSGMRECPAKTPQLTAAGCRILKEFRPMFRVEQG
ncbi:hypothetical protein, partial [Rahnella sp. Larv3_ips]|uniref:hypothetical protein n=1 Tax=Rahnella sp. Larv3_ips TaxID=1896943 RepID=UPI00197D9560